MNSCVCTAGSDTCASTAATWSTYDTEHRRQGIAGTRPPIPHTHSRTELLRNHQHFQTTEQAESRQPCQPTQRRPETEKRCGEADVKALMGAGSGGGGRGGDTALPSPWHTCMPVMRSLANTTSTTLRKRRRSATLSAGTSGSKASHRSIKYVAANRTSALDAGRRRTGMRGTGWDRYNQPAAVTPTVCRQYSGPPALWFSASTSSTRV